MVNAVNTAAQTVAVGSPVLFGSTRIQTGCTVRHEQGSGRFTFTRPGIYKVTFSGTFGTTEASTAILDVTQDGENVASAEIQATTAASPAVLSDSVTTLIRVYCCNSSITVINNSTVPLTISNANIVIDRLC